MCNNIDTVGLRKLAEAAEAAELSDAYDPAPEAFFRAITPDVLLALLDRFEAALALVPHPPEGGKEAGEPVATLVAARKKHRDAVTAYNKRLLLVRAERERGNHSMNVDAEYRTMSDAQSDFIKTAQDVADAILFSPIPARDTARAEGLWLPKETQEFTLRAMAENYKDGHSWDELDGEACVKAANEIKRLRENCVALQHNCNRYRKQRAALTAPVRAAEKKE